MLRKVGFAKEVKSFEQADAALAFLRTHLKNGGARPDYIFLDLFMPVRNGWDFLESYEAMEELKDHTPHILMLSAAFDPADRDRAKQNPLVIDFISKPISKEKLAEIKGSVSP